MKLNKRSLMLIAAIVLCTTMAIGGTLAYLTDTDAAVNTFTVGDVDIKLNEDFEQGTALVPGVEITKEATVTNIGKNDAWVWVTVSVPAPLDVANINDSTHNIVHFNILKEHVWLQDKQTDGSDAYKGEWLFCPNVFTAADDSKTDSQIVTIDGEQYRMWAFLRKDVLPVGAETQPAISKVYLDTHVDYDPIGNRYVWVEKGEVSEINYDLANTKIYVNAFAVQQEGFDDVYKAYDAYMAQWTADNQYTEGMLTLPAVPDVRVESQSGLEDAIATNDKANVFLQNGEYDMPNVASGSSESKDITFVGTKDTVIEMPEGYGAGVNGSNSTITFDGLTINYHGNNYNGIQHAKKVVYRNCTINGQMTNYAPDVEFINCEFNVTGDIYNIWTYGAKNATFTNCTFNSSGKAILVYNEDTNSNFVANITMTGCTFNDDQALKEDDGVTDLLKGAVETGSNANNTATSNKYNLTFTDCKVNGFANTGKGIASGYYEFGNKNSMDTLHLNVIINGVDVY